MSFTYNLSGRGTRERVRKLVSDTSSASYVFEDEEIDEELTAYASDALMAAAQLLRSLAVNHAKRAIWYKVNGFDMDRREPAKLLRQLANDYEETAKSQPFEYESVLEQHITSAGEDRSNYIDSEA